MKIPSPLHSKFKFLITLSAMLSLSDLASSAEIEKFLSNKTIAVCNKADEHKNYCIRYFHRNIEDRDDVVVLLGEMHIKGDKDEAQRGRDLVNQFYCIGRENFNHFRESGFQKFDPKTFIFQDIILVHAGADGLGSTIHEASPTQALFHHIENAIAIGLSKAVKELHNENEAEKKRLCGYINFDPEHGCAIVLGGLLNDYLKKRGIDGGCFNSPINAETLTKWLTTIRDQDNLLTRENADLVDQALVELKHEKKQRGDDIVQSQKPDKLGIRIDLEQGCKATCKDNIFSAVNTFLTVAKFMAVPAFAFWCVTGSRFASACTGIGFVVFAFDRCCEKLCSADPLGIRYVRRYYSLGIETRDKTMAHNIDDFFAKQKDSRPFLGIMGLLHVPGVAEHLMNTYGFREIKPKK